MPKCLPVLLLMLPVATWAKDPLTQASDLLKQLEYRKAFRMAQRVERSPQSGPRELIEAFRVQGISLAARGKRKQAALAFRKLLALDPDFRLSDDISPKLLPPFHQAIGAAERQKPIRLIHQQPEPPENLAGLKLSVALTGNPMRLVKAIKILYRLGDEEEEETVFEIGRPRTVSMVLPKPLEIDRVSYYFVAVNRHGAELARAGTREEPFQLVVAVPETESPKPIVAALAPPPPPPPAAVPPPEDKKEPQPEEASAWYKSWWFWTTVGVVVAAGATTGVVLGLQDDGGPYRYDITIE